MKRVRDYIDKDKMNVSEGDMMLTFKEGKGDDAVDKLEEIEGKDGNIKGCDYVVESVEADVDDPSQAYVKIKVGTPKVETLIKNVLKANKVLGDVSDIDADFGKGEAKTEPKAKKAGKKMEGGEKKAEQKAEQPSAKKSFKDLAWEKKGAKKADSVNNENNTDMKKVEDGLDEDMKLWDERANDEFGQVLYEIEKYAIDLFGTTKDYEVPELEQSIISKYITTYALTGDKNYVARRIYGTLENFDMIDNMDDPHFMELVNEMMELAGLNTVSDSKKIKDNEIEGFNNEFDALVAKNTKKYGRNWTINDLTEEENAEFDELNSRVKSYYDKNNIKYPGWLFDSKKISDAEEKPLNGMLMIAFNDGTEEEMIAEVKKHENEQNDSNGIQYEIYSVDEQDGVALVDMCAVGVKDNNEFVKALLKTWNVLDNVADIDFDVQTEEEYQEEQGEEVSDSKKVNDDDDAFDEYFDYSKESMDDDDKVNDSRRVKDAKDYDFDYNDIVEGGYIPNNSDASLELLELLADFSIYEGYDGENWTSKVRDVLQEYMDTLPQGMVMSNYGEKFYSADELPQWSALEILQTKIFAKEMRMNDQEAVKKIGEYFNLDFNIEPFSSFVEKYANIDGYYEDEEYY